MTTEDLFSYATLGEVSADAISAGGTSTIDMTVELPHQEAELVVVRPQWDGRWVVTLRDRYGVGYDHLITGIGDSPLTASRNCRDGILAAIDARVTRRAEEDARRAASRTVLSPAGGQSIRPEGTLAGGPRAAATGRARSGGGVAVTGAAGYAGSVPRNAALWEVNVGAVRVQLRPGLVWADSGTAEERVFKTVRLAKDATRGAIDG